MAVEVTMPQMGESVVEGTIAKWLVKEGDEVSEDQPLCEISTDKVDTEIPSPSAGIISKILAKTGDTLGVGATLAIIEPAGARATQAPKPAPAAQAAAPPTDSRPQASALPRPQPTLAIKPKPGNAPTAAAPAAVSAAQAAAATAPLRAEPRREAPSNAPSRGAEAQRQQPVEAGGSHRRYSPVVLKIAAEYRLDLARIPGTGIDGRVSKRDVLKYLESLHPVVTKTAPHTNGAAAAAVVRAEEPTKVSAPSPAPLVVVPPAGGTFQPPIYQPREGDTVEPFTRRRKLIAEHMVYSKTHSPHVGTLAEVDLTRLLRLREAHRKAFQQREGFSLTLLPLAAAATVRALKEYPRMNSSVVGDSQMIRKQINLGIAMDSDEGLLVPVIKAAGGMSVVEIAREIERLRRKVQEKKIAAEDLSGGSFTLSNPGREGNLFGFAIINQPQVGILRMGEVKKRPVVTEVDGADAISIHSMMYLALSYDHRVIDGVLGNRFLYRTARILEEADFEL